MSFLKIIFHWLFNIFKGCYICREKIKGKYRWFCSCGYMNNNISWEDHKKNCLICVERDIDS